MKIVRYYPRARAGDGGMTGAVRKWAEATSRAGASVAIAYDGGHSGARSIEVVDGVLWVGVPHGARGLARAPLGFDPVFRDADVIVLHSAWAFHNVVVAAHARRAGVPYVLEPRGAYDPHIVSRNPFRKSVWWRLFEKRLVLGAQAIHVFFDEERPHLDSLGYSGSIIVAPNGVDPHDDHRWDGGSGEYILWLGRFDPQHKGLDVLLRAHATLPRDERHPLRLHGPDWKRRKSSIARAIQELGLDDVTIGPAIYGEEKLRLLARAKSFVYPSRWEACSNAVAQSIAMGVPTVCTPYPLGTWLASLDAAFLADANESSLGRALLESAGSRAAEVGSRGAVLARDELNWDRVAKSWLAQLEAIV